MMKDSAARVILTKGRLKDYPIPAIRARSSSTWMRPAPMMT